MTLNLNFSNELMSDARSQKLGFEKNLDKVDMNENVNVYTHLEGNNILLFILSCQVDIPEFPFTQRSSDIKILKFPLFPIGIIRYYLRIKEAYVVKLLSACIFNEDPMISKICDKK